MIPLPGSLAIDAATTSTITEDQRGFAITDGSPDIGAAEFFPGDIDTILTEFGDDDDNDGLPFLIELAIGTDPFTPDPNSPRALTLTILDDGTPRLTFGYISSTRDTINLEVQRSTDLSNFDVLLDLNTGTLNGVDLDNFDPTDLLQVDDPNLNASKAFYRLKATR